MPNPVHQRLDSLQSLNLSNNLLTGEISEEIGNLMILEGVTTYAHMSVTQYDALNLSNNLFSGFIPLEICDLPLNWESSYMDENQGFNISNNQFCGPYPICLESFVGTQDTSNCIQMYNQKIYNLPLDFCSPHCCIASSLGPSYVLLFIVFAFVRAFVFMSGELTNSSEII